MIKRYTRTQAREIWSDKTYYDNWAKVGFAVLKARHKNGHLAVPIPDNLIDRLKIDAAEIEKIEATTKHNVIAFLMHVSPQLPPEIRPHWHGFMTSYDIIDTAQAFGQLVPSVSLLKTGVIDLMEAVKEKALQYKYTPQIGRTHGVHAEPITFGVKLALWYDELKRDMERLNRLAKIVAVGKLSGAVGMYMLPPQVEKDALESLGLKPILSNQIIPRDIHAEYTSTLAMIGGTIEKICMNIRLLQRTETLEVQEYFDPKQKGSSAMPHKRNPVGSENISGLSRALRGYSLMALETQNNTDERDISNSSIERIFLPDSTILLDYMINRLTNIIKKLIIHPKNMMKNLNLTKGLIYSQDVQTLIAQKSGLPREEAYALVYNIAQKCLDNGLNFLDALKKDPAIMKYVTETELEKCFNLKDKLKYVDFIFQQAFED